MEVEFESRPIRSGSLIWSEDNIIALVTPSILHIFAPLLHDAPDQSPVKFATTSVPALTANNDAPPWKLMKDVGNLRNAMPDQIEFMVAAWSPTGCTRLKGCMLACITSKHSVFLYIPSFSHADRQWMKHVVLDQQIALHWGAEPIVDPNMADNLESTSVAWSPKIFADNIGSLLALGNKTGHIAIWHVTDQNNVRCVMEWKTMSNTWIVRISWSPWVIDNGRFVSTLAYATAEGVVQAQRITFSSSSPLDGIEVSENILNDPHQTAHLCTAMRWNPTSTESASRSNILAFSKGNRLKLWIEKSNKVLVWRKPIAKAIADIVWDSYGEELFVFFMDGKHAVIRLGNDGLEMDEEYTEYVQQEIISRCHVQHRTNITQGDGETDNAKDEDDGGDEEGGGGMGGNKLQLHMISADSSAGCFLLATLYYVTSPFHMEFQRERFQSCTTVISKTHKILQGRATNKLLERLQSFIRLPNAVLTRNPTHQLLELLVFLSESAAVERAQLGISQGLMNILTAATFQSYGNEHAPIPQEVLPNNCTSPEARLESVIFSGSAITADRVSIYLWTHLQKCLPSSPFKKQLQEHAIAAEDRIRKHCTRNILQLFHDHREQGVQIKEIDKTLLLLLCDSILLFHHQDQTLVALAETTYNLLQSQLKDKSDISEQSSMLKEIKKGSIPAYRSFSFGRESCPACDSEALMVPDTSTEPSPTLAGSQAQSWLEIALRSNSVCCFCGERYFTALRRRGT
ncbi:hypothetical protein EDD11_008725 [Mortierella claussenii]|nr:hypothetical protein EDD11_008725 [Mortierella claussenii]